MSQHDIGFNTGIMKWFVTSFSGNRSVILGQNHIENSNLKLKDVMCNTYHWGDQQNPEISHGRLTFYDGNQIEIKATGNLADSYTVTGTDRHFKFTKFMNKSAILKYDLKNAVWKIKIDGNEFITRNIVGLITGVVEKKHVWFDIEPSNIYFSSIITLINPELDEDNKPIQLDQCKPDG